MEELLIKDLMTQTVARVEPSSPLQAVLKQMSEQQLSYAIVVENDEPIGIITERDVVRLMLLTETKQDVLRWPATQVMSGPLVTMAQNETLFDALVVSKTEKLRHLPVVDDNNKLCGIITQVDLAAAHFRVVELQSETIDRAIKEHTKDLVQANKELRALSMEDGLLHIGNRRAMEVDLNHTHATAARYGRPYSIALVDVDYFKKYNDHYGHNAGDGALRAIATLFQESMRSSDRLYRYGGEELLILLADTSVEGAFIFIDRLVKRLAASNIEHCQSPYGFITASAGVACAIDEQNHCLANWDMLVEKADEALYSAKHESRNMAKVA